MWAKINIKIEEDEREIQLNKNKYEMNTTYH